MTAKEARDSPEHIDLNPERVDRITDEKSDGCATGEMEESTQDLHEKASTVDASCAGAVFEPQEAVANEKDQTASSERVSNEDIQQGDSSDDGSRDVTENDTAVDSLPSSVAGEPPLDSVVGEPPLDSVAGEPPLDSVAEEDIEGAQGNQRKQRRRNGEESWEDQSRGGGNRRKPFCSLLVRNLDVETSPDSLRLAFEKFGSIRDVYVPLDYFTRYPKGYGFVEFYDEEKATRAAKTMDRATLGRKEISVSFAQDTRKTPDYMKKLQKRKKTYSPYSKESNEPYRGRSRDTGRRNQDNREFQNRGESKVSETSE